jgi:hypothetical protein
MSPVERYRTNAILTWPGSSKGVGVCCPAWRRHQNCAHHQACTSYSAHHRFPVGTSFDAPCVREWRRRMVVGARGWVEDRVRSWFHVVCRSLGPKPRVSWVPTKHLTLAESVRLHLKSTSTNVQYSHPRASVVIITAPLRAHPCRKRQGIHTTRCRHRRAGSAVMHVPQG